MKETTKLVMDTGNERSCTATLFTAGMLCCQPQLMGEGRDREVQEKPQGPPWTFSVAETTEIVNSLTAGQALKFFQALKVVEWCNAPHFKTGNERLCSNNRKMMPLSLRASLWLCSH